MKFRNFIALMACYSLANFSANAQTLSGGSGDAVKKVIPPQVYGKPKTKKKIDSLAVIQRMKELEQKDKMTTSPSENTNPRTVELKEEQQVQTEIQQNSEMQTKTAQRAVEKNTNHTGNVVILKRNENGEREEESLRIVATEDETPKEAEPVRMMAAAPMPTPVATVERGEKWNLLRCVNYARENNLQVKSAELNERLARLQFQQTRSGRLPNVNGDVSVGESYGRSIDPTSNQFVTKGFLYNSASLNTQALLFGWFQKKYQSEQDRLDVLSVQEANQQLRDDISLNVATGFLRVLLAREQIKIAEAQLQLDAEQYDQTIRFAQAGKIPELNVSQMQSQIANDSSTYIGTVSEEQLALLQLRALMNFDFTKPFDIQTPDINAIEISDMYSFMTPEAIFNHAVQNQHRMKYNHLKLASAKKALRVARSTQYPQLAAFASLGTNFSSNLKTISGQTYAGDETVGYVKVGNDDYPITVPRYTYQTQMTPILDQYNQNLRANAGLSLSVPILNGRSAKLNIERARIGIQSQEISYEVDQQKLKQDIYTAHQQVLSARQKYAATLKAEDAARRSLDFAKKRYAIGMINTFEYTSVQNTHNQASAAALSAKYDLIFKLKVLDYYMGTQIKL